MKRNLSDTFIRLAALGSLIFGIIVSIAIIGATLVINIMVKDLNSGKLIMVDLVAFVIALIIFLLFFGMYEFLISFIKIEGEIEHIEQELTHKSTPASHNSLTNKKEEPEKDSSKVEDVRFEEKKDQDDKNNEGASIYE